MAKYRSFSTEGGYISLFPPLDFREEDVPAERVDGKLDFFGQSRYLNHKLRNSLGHTPEEMQGIIDDSLIDNFRDLAANDNRPVSRSKHVMFIRGDNLENVE
jgi:hypothetical protein